MTDPAGASVDRHTTWSTEYWDDDDPWIFEDEARDYTEHLLATLPIARIPEQLDGWLRSWRESMAPDGRIVISDVWPPHTSLANEILAVLGFAIRRRILLRALMAGCVAGFGTASSSADSRCSESTRRRSSARRPHSDYGRSRSPRTSPIGAGASR